MPNALLSRFRQRRDRRPHLIVNEGIVSPDLQQIAALACVDFQNARSSVAVPLDARLTVKIIAYRIASYGAFQRGIGDLDAILSNNFRLEIARHHVVADVRTRSFPVNKDSAFLIIGNRVVEQIGGARIGIFIIKLRFRSYPDAVSLLAPAKRIIADTGDIVVLYGCDRILMDEYTRLNLAGAVLGGWSGDVEAFDDDVIFLNCRAHLRGLHGAFIEVFV